jgi:prolyl-tRNA editing enzyme YbaK/EbsC (Cys-tRNA(Pro) deacylase)
MTTILNVDTLLRKNGIAYAAVWRDPSPRLGAHRLTRGAQIARTVILADDPSYALAVIPRDRHVDLAAIEEEFGRRLRMASSSEVARLFPGLPPWTLPPIADGPQLETFVDQALVSLSAVYLETARPRRLVHIDGESFRGLFYGAWCGRISRSES